MHSANQEGKSSRRSAGSLGGFGGDFVDRALHGDDVGIHEGERVEKEMEEGVANDIGGDVFAAAEDNRVMVAEITDVGDAADERLDNDREGAHLGGIGKLAQVSVGDEDDLRDGIVEALDFLVVDGLDLAPELANVLLGVVGGKDFAEAFEGQQVGRKLVAAEDGLEFRRGTGDDAEPDVAGEHFADVARFVLAVELADRVNGGAFLLAQAVAHLSAEGGPVVGADVAFEAGGVERAHGGEHGLVAVNSDVGGWSDVGALTGERCLRRCGGGPQYKRQQSNTYFF